MGQGQSTLAVQLLRDCARDGHWLCLKNLHLVTAWLPVLEKVTQPLTMLLHVCVQGLLAGAEYLRAQ